MCQLTCKTTKTLKKRKNCVFMAIDSDENYYYSNKVSQALLYMCEIIDDLERKNIIGALVYLVINIDRYSIFQQSDHCQH